jgi:hypothetical protein
MRRTGKYAVAAIVAIALIVAMAGCGNSGCTVTGGSAGRITGCSTSGTGNDGGRGSGGTASNPQNMVFTLDSPVTGVTLASDGFSVPTDYVATDNPASGITGTIVNKTWVYSVGGQSDNVQVQAFKIDWSTGSLVASGTPLAVPTPPVASNFVLSHAIAADRQGVFLFISGTMSDTSGATQPVLVPYAIDQSTGQLTQLAAPSVLPGTAAKIAVDSSNRFLYLSDTDDGSVFVYVISPAGTIGPATVSPLALGVDGVTTSPIAPFAYATDGTKNVLGFSIDTTTGNLVPLQNAPFATTNFVKTDTIAIHPNGKFLYVSSFTDDTGLHTDLEGFVIADTGDLTQITGSPFAIPEDVIAVGNNGATLFTGVGTLTLRAVGIDLVSGALSDGPTTAMTALTRVVADRP